MRALRVLALDAYHAGSHKAFMTSWIDRSRHGWTLLTLPGHSWKWRMRHAAATFARQIAEIDESWDVIVCTDMLNAAELRGLLPVRHRATPIVLYMHENQLVYPGDPEREPDERDVHFAITNVVSAAAADEVWFNSTYHRVTFLHAIETEMGGLPGRDLAELAPMIEAKAYVHPPGIDIEFTAREREPGPMRIAWAARWEHDKRPDVFFDAMDRLANRGVDFRLIVLGPRFRDAPRAFEAARERHAARIEHWGYAESREDYLRLLACADVFVSTAEQEYFGIAAAEAIALGVRPMLPDRLAYPELIERAGGEPNACVYDGGAEGLADRLAAFRASGPDERMARALIEDVGIGGRAREMDDALDASVKQSH